LGEALHYLTDGMEIEALYFDGRVAGVEVPTFVELEVKSTPPSLKGATATASFKPAQLETGLEVKVPQYISVGDKVRIDTRTNEFIERV